MVSAPDTVRLPIGSTGVNKRWQRLPDPRSDVANMRNQTRTGRNREADALRVRTARRGVGVRSDCVGGVDKSSCEKSAAAFWTTSMTDQLAKRSAVFFGYFTKARAT